MYLFVSHNTDIYLLEMFPIPRQVICGSQSSFLDWQPSQCQISACQLSSPALGHLQSMQKFRKKWCSLIPQPLNHYPDKNGCNIITRSQDSYTTLCKGVVSHEAATGGIQVFAKHTGTLNNCVHDFEPCGLSHMYIVKLKLQNIFT